MLLSVAAGTLQRINSIIVYKIHIKVTGENYVFIECLSKLKRRESISAINFSGFLDGDRYVLTIIFVLLKPLQLWILTSINSPLLILSLFVLYFGINFSRFSESHTRLFIYIANPPPRPELRIGSWRNGSWKPSNTTSLIPFARFSSIKLVSLRDNMSYLEYSSY